MKGIKIHNDVLTKQMLKADGFRVISAILGIIGTAFMTYNYMNPDTTVRTAGHVATSASHMLNRTNTLLNFGLGMDRDRDQEHEQEHEHNERSCFTDPIQEYIDVEVGILIKEGRRYLNRLYGNNEEFRDEIINFVKNKMQLDLEAILDRRYKTNTLNMFGKKYLRECVPSKDNTKDVNEILGKYVGSGSLLGELGA